MRTSRFLIHFLLPATLSLAACADAGEDNPSPDAGETDDIAPIDGSATPDTSDAGGDTTPDADPDVTPDVTPDADPDVTPDVTPDVDPDVTPDVTPDADPDVTPDVVPDVEPDTEPDVVQPDTTVDWCRLQFPTAVSLATGDDELFFVRVFEEGVTDLSAGNDPFAGLTVELGWGADGSDPALDAWTWQPAEPNPAWTDGAEPGNDEYQSTLVATEAGDFDVAFRVSLDAGETYLYCDTSQGVGADGAENGYQPEASAQLTVFVPDVCAPNPCTTPPANTCTDAGTVEQYDPTGTCENIEGAALCDYVPVIATCETGATCVDGSCVFPPAFDFCRLQFPLSLTVEPGTENPYYVRFYGEGLTDGSQENDVIEGAEIQVGIQAGEPALPVTDDTGWQWFDGEPNTMWNGGVSGEPDNDEWQSTVSVDVEDTYRVIARVRASAAGPWLYCDGGAPGSSDGVTLDFLGVLSVETASTDVCDPNPCDAPPAATCVDDITARTYADFGTCLAGSVGAECSYEPVDTVCDVGLFCVDGACVPDEPVSFDFCRLQFPLDATATSVDETNFFVRFYGAGLTDGSDQNDALPDAIIQVGTLLGEPMDPSVDPDVWTWSTGFPNETWNGVAFGEPDNDEWIVPILREVAGDHATAARVSADNGETWLYCDGQAAGSSDGLQLENLGRLLITEPVDACEPNPCTTPPATTCADPNTVLVFSDVGTCTPTDGAPRCEYDSTPLGCAEGTVCSDGVCVVEASPCDDPLVCGSAMAFCDGGVSFVPVGAGFCALEGGAPFCSFEYEEEDCRASDRNCVGGVCVSNSPVDVGFCRLQFPTEVFVPVGLSTTFYARLYAEGLTDVSPTTDLYSELRVQFGTSRAPIDPAIAPLLWQWVEGAGNEGYDGTSSGEPNNDEYQGELNPDAAGLYYTVARASGDGGATWLYCYAGDGGSTVPFGEGSLGVLTALTEK